MKSVGAIDGDDGQRYNKRGETESTSLPNELLTVCTNSSILLHHKTFFSSKSLSKSATSGCGYAISSRRKNSIIQRFDRIGLDFLRSIFFNIQ